MLTLNLHLKRQKEYLYLLREFNKPISRALRLELSTFKELNAFIKRFIC